MNPLSVPPWSVSWRRVDGRGRETFTLARGFRGWTLSGTVHGPKEEGLDLIQYSVKCDEAWRTRKVLVVVTAAGPPRELRLDVDRWGTWSANGSRAPELEGCKDVDLSVTPSTNTLPIRRLGLPLGSAADLLAAWVRFPHLSVQPVRQRYTRLAETRFRYENLDTRFSVTFDVDTLGLVTQYPGAWTRAPNP